jgi:hypothetical protein
MSRPRLLSALAASAAVLAGSLVSAAPADAASQTLLLSISPTVNEKVTFVAAASVTPVKPGRRVDLQVKSGSAWKTLKTVKQDEYGVVSFSAKIGRTSKAKDSKGYENRQVRLRARAAAGLPQKVSAPKKVKLLLDPKVYYRVVRASVQHTENAAIAANGCDVVTTLGATRKTSSALERKESGRPKWRAKRMPNRSIEAEINPGLETTWTQELSGCRYLPAREACTATRVERPTGNGLQNLGVRITIPRSGSKGSAMFYTRAVSVGFPSADDSVCNVPWIASGDVPVKIRTKSVPRSKLLGKKPFTIVNQGQAAWPTNVISGRAADLKMRWTESITLQRVTASGKPIR